MTHRFESKHTLLEARSLPFEERKNPLFSKRTKRLFKGEKTLFWKQTIPLFSKRTNPLLSKLTQSFFSKQTIRLFQGPPAPILLCVVATVVGVSRCHASPLLHCVVIVVSKTFFFRIAASSLWSCSCCRHSALSSRPVPSHRSLIRSARKRELPDRYRQFAVDRTVLRLVRYQTA